MAKIDGRVWDRKLRLIAGREKDPLIYSALFAAGNLIETHAEISITAGSVSGKDHVPSLPGQPPNADTRQLDTSIDTTGDRGEMTVWITSRAPYSTALEWGTSKMAARPFMRPAAKAKRGEAGKLVAKAVSIINRRKA